MGLAPSQSPSGYLRMALPRRRLSMQAWWAAGTVMLAQGSSAWACAGGTQRGASAMAATADAPISFFFISSSSPAPQGPPCCPERVQHLVVSDALRQVFLICMRSLGSPTPKSVEATPEGDALDLPSLPNAERAYRLASGGGGLTVSLPPLKCPRVSRLPSRRRLSDPGVPAELALRSVIGARLAIAHWVSLRGVIGLGSVDASLMGNGIGDAGTGIVGVCLCGWNAEGCQCYHRCRRRAH
jgi:hypothetical protein